MKNMINISGLIKGNTERQSNMELLRMVAILAIVFYHILLFVHNNLSDAPIYQALFLPLHVGVLLFVMISGYFRIKFSIKKLIILIVPLLIYSLPSIIDTLFCGEYSFHDKVNSILFISHSQYWFMRIYIGLFLLAPVLNVYLDKCSDGGRAALLISLLFIAVWGGGVTLGDQSLIDGKNIINFMLLYVIGDTARKYSDVLSRFRVRGVLGTYIVFNVFIVVVCTLFSETKLVQILFILCYQYCSPGLLINAILIFFLFMRINVKSSLINYSASSVFAVYLIHCNNVVFPNIVKPLIVSLFKTDNCFLSIIFLFLLAVGLFVACIVIDKMLTPIWKQTLTLAEKIDRKLKIDYK